MKNSKNSAIIAFRVPRDMDRFIEQLTAVHNKNGEPRWSKSRMVRFVLERGVQIVSKENGVARHAKP